MFDLVEEVWPLFVVHALSNNPGRQSQAKGLSSFYRCHGGLIAISPVHMALSTTGLRLKMVLAISYSVMQCLASWPEKTQLHTILWGDTSYHYPPPLPSFIKV